MLNEFPDHLVAEIAKHLDAASDVLALERALEVSAVPMRKATPATTLAKAKTTTETPTFRVGHGSARLAGELVKASKALDDEDKSLDAESGCFEFQEEPRTGSERVNDNASDDGKRLVTASHNGDDKPPPPPLVRATPPPPHLSLLEEVLRLRWRDAWILAGLPKKAAVDAGVACAYAAALARAGGPPVRSCALAGYSSSESSSTSSSSSNSSSSDGDEDSDGREEEAAAVAPAARGLFGMEVSTPPSSPSPHRPSSSSSPCSVFYPLLPPCCGGGGASSPSSPSSSKGKRSSSSPSSSSFSYRHLPPASAVAAALDALSRDAPRLRQVARLSVVEALGPEPPLLRRAYRGFSYSPPEERGGLLLSEEDDEEASAQAAFYSPSPNPSSRSRSSFSPSPAPPRLGEVSAEFLAWQTAASHLAAAFSSRLAWCAAAARGKEAAEELARRAKEEGEGATAAARKKRKEAAVAAPAAA